MDPLRVFPEQYAAAFAFGQDAQLRKITFAEQNGASDQRVRVIYEPMSQPEDLPFCFFLPFDAGLRIPAEDAHHALHGLPLKQGLVAGQEHTARKVGPRRQQGVQPQPHRVVPARQCVDEAGDALRFAECFHLRRAGHDDAGSKLGRVGRVQCAAEQGTPAEIGQELIGTEPPGQPRRHDDTPNGKKLLLHLLNTSHKMTAPWQGALLVVF